MSSKNGFSLYFAKLESNDQCRYDWTWLRYHLFLVIAFKQRVINFKFNLILMPFVCSNLHVHEVFDSIIKIICGAEIVLWKFQQSEIPCWFFVAYNILDMGSQK